MESTPTAASAPVASPPSEDGPPAGVIDVITMGRLGVDLYPAQSGVGLDEVETFHKYLGGSPANVAVAAARLGHRAALVSRVGDDPFGAYCRRALGEFGVDARWVSTTAAYPTPVTFCELFPPDDFPLYFYRRPRAPDLELHPEHLDLAALRAARIFWMSGTGLCTEPSRATTLAALEARRSDRPGQVATVFDLDWREVFWDSGPDAARVHYAQALQHATVAVGNVAECEVATGQREPRACAEALLAHGVELAVVKQGPDGVLAVHRDGTTAEVPPHPVEVVNGLGAGDAFGGALCHGLLAGWDLERTLRHANAAGALVASRHSCSAAMPTAAEVTALLAGNTRSAGDGTPADRTPSHGPAGDGAPGQGPAGDGPAGDGPAAPH